MGEILKVLLVEPGQYPKQIEVEHTLANLQKLVGGDIEPVYPWKEPVCIVCNDEGKLNGSPLNRPLEDYDILAGSFFICGLGKGDFCSLTPEQMQRYEEKYHDPQWFFQTPWGISSRSCTPEQYRQLDQICRRHTKPKREER